MAACHGARSCGSAGTSASTTHPALTAAVAAADEVVPLFVLDDRLLAGRWASANRAWFMRESLVVLSEALADRGASLRVLRGRPEDVVVRLAREIGATDLYLTREASPFARARDRSVATSAGAGGIVVHAERGHFVHEPDEVATRDGRPFAVYGAFRRAWDALPRPVVVPAPSRISVLGARGRTRDRPVEIPDLGLPTADPALIPVPGEAAARDRLARWAGSADSGAPGSGAPGSGAPGSGARDGGASPPVDGYADARNRLALDGTSRLSQDLRFGLLSAAEVADRVAGPGDGRRVFLAELAWREFYAHVLWSRPDVLRVPLKDDLAGLPYRDDPAAFDAWTEGRTGYPLVDAAMRQLRASGFVHNRARMVAASFLAKHLLLDYRLGEAEFMRHLTDGDPASNNGGWQWTASTGTDPQPWFRVFNPVLQGRRFDPDGTYVRRWVPELRGVPADRIHAPWEMMGEEQAAAGCRIGADYPAPIVDHAEARVRALEAYRRAREVAQSD